MHNSQSCTQLGPSPTVLELNTHACARSISIPGALYEIPESAATQLENPLIAWTVCNQPSDKCDLAATASQTGMIFLNFVKGA